MCADPITAVVHVGLSRSEPYEWGLQFFLVVLGRGTL